MKKILFCALSLFTSISIAANPAPQKLTVMLDWLPKPEHAPLMIAKEKGYFKEQGLDVVIVAPANPLATPRAVADGFADIGITYEPRLMQEIDHGWPLIRVGTLIDKPLRCVVALRNSGVNKISDLKGQAVGSDNPGLPSAMAKTMLERNGAQNKDISIVNIRYGLTQALLEHHVKAVTGVMRNIDVPRLEAFNNKLIVFFPEEHGMPNYSELIFISHIKNAHDSRYPRFLAALKKAVRYVNTHPKQAWQTFANRFPELDTPDQQETWFATLPYYAKDPANFNRIEWQQFADYMRQNNLIKASQPVARYSV